MCRVFKDGPGTDGRADERSNDHPPMMGPRQISHFPHIIVRSCIICARRARFPPGAPPIAKGSIANSPCAG